MRPSKVTKQQLAAYDEAHPDAPKGQAARYFGVSDRYIRDLRAELRKDAPAAAAPVRTRPRLRVVNTPQYPPPPARPVLRLVMAEYMKCPRCGELMPPLPSDTVESWQRSGCHQCRVRPRNDLQPLTLTPAEAPAPEAEPEPSAAPFVPEDNSETNALQSETSAAPVPAAELSPGAPASPTAAEIAPAPAAAPAPMIVRTIVRTVYVRSSLITMLDHVPLQVMLGVVVGLLLIGLAAAGVR